MNFFLKVKTIEDLRRQYRRLSKIHHPDTGGNEETFKELNKQRDETARKLLSGKMSESEINSALSNEQWMETLNDFGIEKLAEMKSGNIAGSIMAMAKKTEEEMLAGNEQDLLDEKGNVSFSKVTAHVFKSLFRNPGKDLEAGKDQETKKLNP